MTRLIPLLAGLGLLLPAAGIAGTPALEKRLDDSIEVLTQFTQIPERGIPARLLNNAYGVAVIPNTIKAGFMLAGRFGQGVLVVRRPDGSWSNPSFIRLAGGSFGLQAGAESTDIVLVFKTKRSVDRIAKGKLKLGADVAVAAGPWGRSTSAATDLSLKAEIFSYARSRGLFGGIALDGSVLSMDEKANAAYYQSGPGDANIILGDATVPAPARAREFKQLLASVAPPLNWQANGSRTASVDEQPAQPARTYGLDEAPAATPEGDVIF
ncbi:MAG: hypothetical protein D6727_03985 [Gammaproteobacteria bacterium]|nr:MAG: hypothetical protein D6727_03985 [Gammaproteobacteria bacterium]